MIRIPVLPELHSEAVAKVLSVTRWLPFRLLYTAYWPVTVA